MSQGSLRRRLLSASALASVLSVAALPGHAGGLPARGHFVAGQGSINKASQSLTVKQSSTTGIIDWNSFSIGSKGSVTFNNGSGATLNRVTGGDLSRIAGSLHATGSLYLLNSQGVIVSGTGRVVTGGNFVATSGNTLDSAFDDGKRKFVDAKAAVINRGSITAGGSAGLIGSTVTESGAIQAGSVKLRGREGLVISGSLIAQRANGTGGTITATGRTVDVASTARISASGTQGGKVLIGGDIHGGAIAADDFSHNHIRDARRTTIASGASISANASKGAGGDIVIWSDGHTTFGGKVSATGRSAGGFAEVSSHKVLGFQGRVDLLARHGQTGMLLLDPENVVISTAATLNGAIAAGTFTPTGDDSILNVGDLEAALGNADVTVTSGATGTQTGDITVLAPVAWSANTLTLDAFHAINIDAQVALSSTAGISLITNDGGTGGDIFFNDGGRIAFTGYSDGDNTHLTINGQAYTLENSVAGLASAISGNASGFYALADNYDASGDNSGAAYTSSPIQTVFTGTFEGLGNTVSNLTINDSTGATVGFFSGVGDGVTAATIRDFGLVNANITGSAGGALVGGLVAQLDGSTLSHAFVTGTVNGTTDGQVGGLVGSASDNASILNSHATATVTATTASDVGGLIGEAVQTTMENDHASGAVTGGSNTDAGGFAGELDTGTVVDDDHATSAVSGNGDNDLAGGFAGFTSASVTNSYASGTVSMAGGSESPEIGGFAGIANGTLSNDYATGDVFLGTAAGSPNVGGFAAISSGTLDHIWASGNVQIADTPQGQFPEVIAGGLLGELGGSGTVTNSFATGNVTAGAIYDPVQGGFVGFADSTTSISNSYATGAVSVANVTGGGQIGGFVGYGRGAISKSYETGAVTGAVTGTSLQAGGFVGLNDSSATIDESYSSGAVSGGSSVGGFAGANHNTSGIGTSVADYYNSTANTGGAVGQDAASSEAGVGGITAANMLKTSSFVGWTFGTTGGSSGWVIVDLDGSLNNASGATGGTMPMLLSEYSTTITNAHQLQLMALDLTANYTLTNNINATGTAGGDVWSSNGFVPIGNNIGNDGDAYTGTFDGQNHVIDGLFIDSDPSGTHPELSWVGLFGYLGGTVENLGLSNVNVTVTGNNSSGVWVGVGALAGDSYGTITNAWSSGTVTASQADGTDTFVGGLVGSMTGNGSTISNSHSSATVTDPGTLGAAGGLLGYAFSTFNGDTIENSYATGNVSGGDVETVGGLIGAIASNMSVTDSYATGAVSGGNGSEAGGFIGDDQNDDSTITRSFATGNVTGGGDDSDFNAKGEAGGFAGKADAQISEAYAGGNVSKVSGAPSGGNFGGFIGGVGQDAIIAQSYSTGSITGDSTATVGGFVGSNGGNIDESYTLSKVTGGETGSTGAFAGNNNTAGSLGASIKDYYDSDVNGSLVGVGETSGTGTVTVGALTTTLMHSTTSFAGWSFDTTPGGSGWVIVDQDGSLNNSSGAFGGTTPMLLSEYSTAITNAHQLQLMELDPTATYTLAKDVDASGTAGGDVWGSQGFIAIGGNSAGNFSGSFDGASHTINGLFIDDTTNNDVGLFGTATGTIENVALTDANVQAQTSGASVGVLAGSISGSVSNASAAGVVTAMNGLDVGGLLGDNTDGSVSNSHADVAVTAGADALVGGLIGHNEGSLTGSYATGDVVGGDGSDVGGLVGETFDDISNSFATGSVTGGGLSHDGGLVGSSNTGTLHDTFATGSVTGGNSSEVGGLEGESTGAIDHSNATGNVLGGVGATVGGLVGFNATPITDSYATGNATAGSNSYVGGLVGINQTGTIDESYSLGAAVGDSGSTVGGLIGENNGSAGATTAVYFSSDNNTGAGVGSGNAIANGSGLSHTDMQNSASFVGWVFGALGSGADWVIVDADDTLNNASSTGGTTPMLLSEYSTTIANAHQLQLMQLDLAAHYTVVADIDASDTQHSYDGVWGSHGFVPVGNFFDGSLDGGGHTITGLTIEDPIIPDVGLFSSVDDGASVSNVTLANVHIVASGADSDVGAIAGSNDGTISNVTISGSISVSGNSTDAGGVAGFLEGSISNAHSSASVNASDDSGGNGAGGLVGFNNFGTITQSSASGNVSVDGDDVVAGGLVGVNGGTISQSFAGGSVTVTDSSSSSANQAGGFVGTNDDGAISQSYSVGNVSMNGGNGSLVGGFAGGNENSGTIEDSYSIGVVSAGAGFGGGFVGLEQSSTITNSYWDTQTSGLSSSHGVGNGSSTGLTGKTTSALEAGLLSGFDNSTWGIVAGTSLPYLNWQFLSGAPQVVSGTVVLGIGEPAISGSSVWLLQGGANLDSDLTDGSVKSYANGFYYFLLAPGSIDALSNPGLIAYDPGLHAEAFADQASGSFAGLNLTDNFENEMTSQTTLSAVSSDLARAVNGNSVVANLLSTTPNREIDSTGGFTIDQPITLGGETLIVSAASGSVNQTGAINVGNLLLEGDANFTLSDASNSFSTLAMTGAGSLNVTDDHSLTIGNVGNVSGVTAGGGISITTTSGNIAIARQLGDGSHPVTLDSAGSISESGAGFIDASELTGSSTGSTALNSTSNLITDLGTFASGNTFALTDDRDLAVDGTLNAGTHTVELTTKGSGHDIAIGAKIEGSTVDLVSAATVTENSSGDIDATKLEGSSVSTAEMNSAKNTITDLGTFISGSTFELTDDHDLTVDGTVDAGAHTVKLTTTGSGHDIAIDDKVEGSTVELISSATIVEDSSGDIDATKLEGSSASTTEMNSTKNTITDLGPFTSGSTFELTDDHDLTVDGTVNAGSHTVELTTKGSGHDIAVDAKVEGSTVKLSAAATIAESSAGDIDAAKLEGSSVGTAEMTSAKNTITDLGTFTSGSTFELTDDHDLTVDGTVNAGSHTAELTTKGSGHGIAVHAKLKGGTVKLASAATIAESSAGDIDATKLEGSSAGTTKLTSAKNTLADLAAFTSGSTFALTDDHTLTVDGTVNAGSHNIDLTTTGSGHNIAIDAKLEGKTINLVSAAKATESSAGAIDAHLLNVTAKTGIELTSTKNKIKKLGTDKTKTGPNKVTL